MHAQLHIAPPTAPAPGPIARPVFLVQGLGASVAVLQPLERRIHRLGRPTFCASPSLHFGDVRGAAARLRDAIEEWALSAPFEYADVIGHSMGGLVASYTLKCLDRGRRIRRVIALGTPFRGLASARLGALLLGPFGSSLDQMAPGSPLLRRLAAFPVPPGSELVSIAGTADWLVPSVATRLPETDGHRHVELPSLGHCDLLLRQRCFAQVERALAPLAKAVGAGQAQVLTVRPAA
jgi:hypothetical protein